MRLGAALDLSIVFHSCLKGKYLVVCLNMFSQELFINVVQYLLRTAFANMYFLP